MLLEVGCRFAWGDTSQRRIPQLLWDTGEGVFDVKQCQAALNLLHPQRV